MNPIDRQILQIALPSIVSNITVPLLGLIDVAIVGHLGSPAYIGAIAVGGMLFNIIYWIFGFLRMGTSGMTSQAYGKRDLPEIVRLLIRSVGIGLAVALCLILLQVPIRQAAFQIIRPTEEVGEMATLYFHICIWGAPAMLGLYGLSGWYIGMQNSRIPMYIAITQNIVNIMASLSLVCFFGMKVEGVALGTLIAQYAGLLMGLALWMNRYGKLKKYIVWKGVLQKEAIENLDIIPTSIDLSAAEIELIGVDDKEFIIRNAIAPIKDNYDYIIIDCPPSLSMLTINAMTTADSVLVPIQCEYYALEGLSQLIHTVELVKERLNPILKIEGVVFTMYDARTNLSLQVVENVKENLQQNIYKTIIPRNIRLAEAPSYGMPINLYDPKSTGASAYQRLADEVMNRE